MKITKQRLKQIIREELENVLLNDGVKGFIPDEDLDPETGERKDLARKAASDAADAYEDVEVAMGLDPEKTSLGPGGTARSTARGHTERYIKATGGYKPRRFVPDSKK
jgi:hypothetical protein